MKLKGKYYYALLCDCSQKGRKDMLICGVYGSRKEAFKAKQEVKECPAKHYVKKCEVTIKTL